jgi:hypothetical protein
MIAPHQCSGNAYAIGRRETFRLTGPEPSWVKEDIETKSIGTDCKMQPTFSALGNFHALG